MIVKLLVGFSHCFYLRSLDVFYKYKPISRGELVEINMCGLCRLHRIVLSEKTFSVEQVLIFLVECDFLYLYANLGLGLFD